MYVTLVVGLLNESNEYQSNEKVDTSFNSAIMFKSGWYLPNILLIATLIKKPSMALNFMSWNWILCYNDTTCYFVSAQD